MLVDKDKQTYYELGVHLGIEWTEVKFDLDQFIRGYKTEYKEHGPSKEHPETDIVKNDLTIPGRIALAHLYEIHDYYDKLDAMEEKWADEDEEDN